ncbi:hypothetical protein ACHAP8_010717, partial [Fusarium lateritium]
MTKTPNGDIGGHDWRGDLSDDDAVAVKMMIRYLYTGSEYLQRYLYPRRMIRSKDRAGVRFSEKT